MIFFAGAGVLAVVLPPGIRQCVVQSLEYLPGWRRVPLHPTKCCCPVSPLHQDLLVASLFRNFLLAERILAAANATPVSWPRLPPTHQHPMWQAWDMAAEMCLLQVETRGKGRFLRGDNRVSSAEALTRRLASRCCSSVSPGMWVAPALSPLP